MAQRKLCINECNRPVHFSPTCTHDPGGLNTRAPSMQGSPGWSSGADGMAEILSRNQGHTVNNLSSKSFARDQRNGCFVEKCPSLFIKHLDHNPAHQLRCSAMGDWKCCVPSARKAPALPQPLLVPRQITWGILARPSCNQDRLPAPILQPEATSGRRSHYSVRLRWARVMGGWILA